MKKYFVIFTMVICGLTTVQAKADCFSDLSSRGYNISKVSVQNACSSSFDHLCILAVADLGFDISSVGAQNACGSLIDHQCIIQRAKSGFNISDVNVQNTCPKRTF